MILSVFPGSGQKRALVSLGGGLSLAGHKVVSLLVTRQCSGRRRLPARLSRRGRRVAEDFSQHRRHVECRRGRRGSTQRRGSEGGARRQRANTERVVLRLPAKRCTPTNQMRRARRVRGILLFINENFHLLSEALSTPLTGYENPTTVRDHRKPTPARNGVLRFSSIAMAHWPRSSVVLKEAATLFAVRAGVSATSFPAARR